MLPWRSWPRRGAEVAGLRCDVSDLDDIRALESFARERFGNVHVLCNNAGVGSGGLIAEPDDLDLWKWVIDVNLWGVIYGCKVFLPAMIEHGEGAHIVNTASMAGHASAPLMGPYNVSKYGVVALVGDAVQGDADDRVRRRGVGPVPGVRADGDRVEPTQHAGRTQGRAGSRSGEATRSRRSIR